MTNRTPNGALILGAACGLLIGTPALAQDDTKPGSRHDAPVLRGPRVSDDRAPGTDSRFSMGMERSRESERPIPLRVYEQELRKLSGDKATDGVHLSAEQQAAIRKAIGEHRSAMRTFYQAHREELAAIRAGDRPGDAVHSDKPVDTRLGVRRGQNDRRNTGQSTDLNSGQGDEKNARDRRGVQRRGGRAMSPGAREKMRALRARGPQESAVIANIWGVLNGAQRGRLVSRFEQIREGAMREREQRKAAQRRGDGVTDRVTDRAATDNRLPPHARKRLEGMTPEQRREAIERMRHRRSSVGTSTDSSAPTRPKGRASDKPKSDD